MTTTTISSISLTTKAFPSDLVVVTLTNTSAVSREFDGGDISLQVPGSAYSSGVRQLLVDSGVRGSEINASNVVRPFASFVSIQVLPAGVGIGANPLQLCLTTALFNGRLCWAIYDFDERGWQCTNVTTFVSDRKTCARVDSLPLDGTPRAFTLLAASDLQPSTGTSRTLPDGLDTTTGKSSTTNVTAICVVNNQEGGVLCDIDAQARDAWQRFLELGDAVVGVVIAAIVLCVICCYVLIWFLQMKSSRKRDDDDETVPPQSKRGTEMRSQPVSTSVAEMSESSSSGGGGARSKKRAKERARERIVVDTPRARRSRADESKSSSSSDNYEKFEHLAGVHDTESSASEHVLVMQTVQVAETPVAIERSGKNPRPTSQSNSSKSTSSKSGKRTKKKKKPSVPDDLTPPPPLEQSLSASSSSDGELKWGRVEKMKN